MNEFSYSIFTKPRNLTEFSTGSNWLVSLTAEKRDKLLVLLKPFAESGNIDSQKIDSTIAEFIDWFVEDYEKREKKEFPYEDNEIVESVGIISINNKGQYTVYTYGKIRFHQITQSQTISNVNNKGQLSEHDTLIANPKNASITDSILAIENKQTTETEAEKYHDFPYPFATIRPEPKIITTIPTEKKKLFPIAIALSIALLIATGAVVWFNKDSIARRIAGISADSSAIQNSLVENRVQPLSANDYFQKAEQTFDFAKSSMEDGKNAKAILQLDSAAFYYQKTLESDPTYQTRIEIKLNEINARKSVLSPNEALE